MKNLAILGSTGSIGTQTIEVIDEFKDDFSLKLISGNRNHKLLLEQIEKYKPLYALVEDKEAFGIVKSQTSGNTKVLRGFDELENIIEEEKINFAVGAISGAAGITPTLKFLEKGIDVGLANKETLVSAGDLVKQILKGNSAKVITMDSEHSAIMQCLEKNQSTKKILLTASGGPFRNYSQEELENVGVKDALNHPTWSMGQKITIDSASLMNKGLEVIEASWLFDVDFDDIEVVIHPESIVHSMVQYGDGSILGHLGPKDMRIPIQYALTYPERINNNFPKIDLTEICQLNFFKPDMEKFPCLRLAYEAGKIGKSMTTVLNAANEIAVALFLKEKIKFTEIPRIIEKVLEKHDPKSYSSVQEVIEIDRKAREDALKIIE